MMKLLKTLIKKASQAYQAKRLAKKIEQNAKHNIQVANDFYYSE